ncbi:GyrI-like domain-containing protein [Paenibacillus cremeus]|uniref:AraC family transcriptional regulator n=1 Tax=Paenibacillus cremeus TaxID=2163881 RepID=A0A559KFH6_9BACL|nr:effector binding domain-containing protein [Paenibacillus cremeus]TVY10884.1 AraC family transcriptional regulator [Paenibacillus cremeus]
MSATIQPMVVTLPSFTVVGISYEANLNEIIEQQLGKSAHRTLQDRTGELPSRLNDHVYLIQVYPKKKGFNPHVDAFTQVIGYVVPEGTTPPEGMSARTLPEKQYVKMTHSGLESELGRTYDLLYGPWMQQSERCPDGFDFEIWDERYKPEQANNEIDVFVALFK